MNFSLPEYIVNMNAELLEEDFEPPDADRALSRRSSGTFDDLAAGFSDFPAATASTSVVLPSVAWGPTTDALNDVSFSLTELSAKTTKAPATPRSARGHKRLKPIDNKPKPTKLAQGEIPTCPVADFMPQHLASDAYWQREPMYVSAHQVQWEKRDGAPTIVAIRREIMPKLCGWDARSFEGCGWDGSRKAKTAQSRDTVDPTGKHVRGNRVVIEANAQRTEADIRLEKKRRQRHGRLATD